jgi:tetratricopeptide (TPR) repeat protein
MRLDSEGPKHLPVRVAYLDERTKALYLKAQELFRAGRYAEAREMFIRVSFRQPLLGECHGYLGQYYLEQEKDYSRAIDYLTRAIKNCRPDHRHVSLYYMALAYEGAQRKVEAVKTWEEYLKVCPKGSSRETEAKKHIEKLTAQPAPTPSPPLVSLGFTPKTNVG